ncbi:sugar transferase [Patescibacteria group bacterium]|nr:sugar transferase [Patescibacteria group bacterium]
MLSYQIAKRTADIIGSLIGVAIMVVLYPFVALAILIDSRGPVIVALDRVSEGKLIKVYKFRSMRANSHQLKYGELAPLNERHDGPFFKMRRDPRLTRVGKVLRKFRIDEFPQFINVLKGELSLVGPRPHEPEEIAHYPAEYRHLPLAKAGITGYSQVQGASSLPFLKELSLDDFYVKHQSPSLDMKIVARTLLILFFDPTAV